MRPISRITGPAIPLGLDNVDTDMILPARFLGGLTRRGLGKYAFMDLRYSERGVNRLDNVFHEPRFRQAPILVAGENFGCGSSREHAVWALLDLGIKAVVAGSFGDIFSGNAFKNGLVLVTLPKGEIRRVLHEARHFDVDIDVQAQKLRIGADYISFELDPFRKRCLVEGLDEIAITEQLEKQISAFHQRASMVSPWLIKAPRAQTTSDPLDATAHQRLR